MHSRAYLLINKEIEILQQKSPWGIEASRAFPESNFKWIVKMKGPKESDWEDGVFQLSVQFTEEFNDVPPIIHFLTIPFHPNVEPTTGYVAINYSDRPEMGPLSLTNLLISVQKLLVNPDPHCVVNTEAGDLLVNQFDLYRRITRECVQASLRLEESAVSGSAAKQGIVTKNGIRIEYAENVNQKESAEKSKGQSKKKVAHVNFEEYLATWAGIATSKATPDSKNPYLTMIEDKPNLISVHQCLPIQEIENQLVQQMEQHRTFLYGNISKKSKSSSQSAKDENIKRIEKMRKIYISQRTCSNLSRPGHSASGGHDMSRDELDDPVDENVEGDFPVDEDVDDLVAWTKQLDQSVV